MPATDWIAHFETLYARSADPWNLTTSDYEVRKYAATLEALGGRRFTRGLEIGCAMGTLTLRLAPSCEEYLGIDLVEPPLIDARARCAHLAQARFERMAIPREWPRGRFDLIVMSEVLYFLPLADLDQLAAHCTASLDPGGTLLLVNWLGPNDGAMSGEAAAQGFLSALPPEWPCINNVMTPQYRIDVARAPGGQSRAPGRHVRYGPSSSTPTA